MIQCEEIHTGRMGHVIPNTGRKESSKVDVRPQVYKPDRLNELMADSDYVVMALPYTPGTHHFVNAAAINSMRSNGVLINVGRGKTLEEAALIKGRLSDLADVKLVKLKAQHILLREERIYAEILYCVKATGHWLLCK